MKCFAATVFFALASVPARAEIVNLSCDDGGMLLTADTSAKTITDKNPFQHTSVTAPLNITATQWRWHEGPENGEMSADYAVDLASRKVSGTSGGPTHPEAIQFSNPQCGRSATPRARPSGQ
ncbi:MAG TPA: hypothetical protein VN723_11440 [Rhizomicrobium sp.]|jgi:hypothetical protein|nr:hypothetical protein [Rhizomicrobium sp.]